MTNATMSQGKNCAGRPERVAVLRMGMDSKLKPLSTPCKRALLRSALAVLLAGCPPRRSAPPAPAPAAPAGPAAAASAPPHIGEPYDVVTRESLLTVLVYRAGPMARMGHNHVIASHELAGT